MTKYLFDKAVYLNYLKRIRRNEDSYRDGTSSTARGNTGSEFEKTFCKKLTDQMQKSHIPHPKERHIG
jgi:hypothetical protein